MKKKLKEMMARNDKIYLWTFFFFLFSCNFSFGTENSKERNYPSLRIVLSLLDEDKNQVLPVFDKKNPYEFIFNCFINDNKITKQEITSIKDALIGIKCDVGQKKQRIQKFFLLNLVSDDMDQDPICVSIHDEDVIKRYNLRKQFQEKASNFLGCFYGERKLKIKQKIELYNDLLKLDENQDLKDYKDLSKNINSILLKKNIFQNYENWFEYLINWLISIQKEEKLSAVVDGLLEINGKFMSTTVIDRLPSMLSIVNVLGILTTAVIFLKATQSDVVNNKNIYTVNGTLTSIQLLNYGKEECLGAAYKFSSIFSKNTTDYLNNTVENYFYNMTCLGISQAYTYKNIDIVFFVVAIPFLSSFIYFISVYRAMIHNISFYLMGRNMELTNDKMINIIYDALEEIPEENLNSRNAMIKSLSSSLGELIKNAHFFSFYEWKISGKIIKNSIYQDLKEISNSLIRFINKNFIMGENIENPLQNGDMV